MVITRQLVEGGVEQFGWLREKGPVCRDASTCAAPAVSAMASSAKRSDRSPSEGCGIVLHGAWRPSGVGAAQARGVQGAAAPGAVRNAAAG
jgi:hypothetical protein